MNQQYVIGCVHDGERSPVPESRLGPVELDSRVQAVLPVVLNSGCYKGSGQVVVGQGSRVPASAPASASPWAPGPGWPRASAPALGWPWARAPQWQWVPGLAWLWGRGPPWRWAPAPGQDRPRRRQPPGRRRRPRPEARTVRSHQRVLAGTSLLTNSPTVAFSLDSKVHPSSVVLFATAYHTLCAAVYEQDVPNIPRPTRNSLRTRREVPAIAGGNLCATNIHSKHH